MWSRGVKKVGDEIKDKTFNSQSTIEDVVYLIDLIYICTDIMKLYSFDTSPLLSLVSTIYDQYSHFILHNAHSKFLQVLPSPLPFYLSSLLHSYSPLPLPSPFLPLLSPLSILILPFLSFLPFLLPLSMLFLSSFFPDFLPSIPPIIHFSTPYPSSFNVFPSDPLQHKLPFLLPFPFSSLLALLDFRQ